MPEPASVSSPAATHDPTSYTVVARRYRPKSFQELVGQEHISQALAKAISTGRVGHAYLFTGARGVGKTSSARIFAKALNAPGGPTAEPAPDSDIAQAIDAGEDVDVIEIDAASNRGIDEIRQLRANVSVRPSRSRYKIYIIDEVHMLTTPAFNALLKTLEEPPEHVKFIFCTTDPEKLPITVLSRCQRFDFAPVRPDAIQKRLDEICQAEGFEADGDALALIARRAAGSMRDSQSLLEQVMSFSSGKITVDQVHALLGTADESRLRELAEALAGRDGVAALKLVDKAIAEGTDAGQFAEQMLGYLRDLMAVAVGGGPDLLKMCNPSGFEQVKELADRWGLQTILAAVQLLDESLVRMRFSVQSQALFEVSLIQISQLQDLASIAKIIESASQGAPRPAAAPPRVAAAAPTSEKKNVEGLNRTASAPSGQPATAPQVSPGRATSPTATASATVAAPTAASVHTAPSPPTIAITAPPTISIAAPSATSSTVTHSASGAAPVSHQSPQAQAALEAWKAAVATIEGMLGDFAALAVRIECQSPDKWTVVFPAGSNKSVEYIDVPSRRAEIQAALDQAAKRPIQFTFRVLSGPVERRVVENPVSSAVARSQRMRQLAEHPYVSKLCELVQGEIVRVDPPQAPSPTPPQTAPPASAPATESRQEVSTANAQ